MFPFIMSAWIANYSIQNKQKMTCLDFEFFRRTNENRIVLNYSDSQIRELFWKCQPELKKIMYERSTILERLLSILNDFKCLSEIISK